jgi:hypothetical protein
LLLALRRGDHVLPTVLHPQDLAAGRPGRQRHGDLLRRRRDILPESPADVADDHPHRGDVRAETGGDLPLEQVGGLGGAANGHQAGDGVVRGRTRTALHRCGRDPAGGERPGDHVVGGGEGRLEARGRALTPIHLVAAQDGVEGRQRRCRPRVDDGRQRCVADLGPFRGVLGEGPALGQHDRDRLTHEPHALTRQRGLRGPDETGHGDRVDQRDVRQVGRGQDGHHAAGRARLADVDVVDQGVRVRRPDEDRVETVPRRGVGGEHPAPAEEPAVLEPWEPRPQGAVRVRIAHNDLPPFSAEHSCGVVLLTHVLRQYEAWSSSAA